MEIRRRNAAHHNTGENQCLLHRKRGQEQEAMRGLAGGGVSAVAMQHGVPIHISMVCQYISAWCANSKLKMGSIAGTTRGRAGY